MRILINIKRKQANCSKYNVSISFLFLYLASAKITVNTLIRMQKYKFYFEMEGRNGEKVIFKKKKMVFTDRKQLTGKSVRR